jgi:Fic family protein
MTIRRVQELESKVAQLEQENAKLKEECQRSCKESFIKEMQQEYDIPGYLLETATAKEILQEGSLKRIHQMMAYRYRLIYGGPRLVRRKAINEENTIR